jgi:hypothetical protein
MREELDAKLVAKYPQIFKNRFGDMRETAMCWGFECGDGWYNIIDVLCGLMTSEYRQRKESYEFAKECLEKHGGKFPWGGDKEVTAKEVEEKRLAMEEAAARIPVASQVKEKFGGLRFYVQAATDKHYNYITFAENMSYHTCEECGKPGTYYPFGWHHVSCDEHATEEDKENLRLREQEGEDNDE